MNIKSDPCAKCGSRERKSGVWCQVTIYTTQNRKERVYRYHEECIDVEDTKRSYALVDIVRTHDLDTQPEIQLFHSGGTIPRDDVAFRVTTKHSCEVRPSVSVRVTAGGRDRDGEYLFPELRRPARVGQSVRRHVDDTKEGGSGPHDM